MTQTQERDYDLVARAVFGEPWAITAAYYAIICEVVRQRIAGGPTLEELAAIGGKSMEEWGVTTPEAAGHRRGAARRGSVAVLPLYGVLGQRMGMMNVASGGTSTAQFGQAFREAVSDSSIGAIVIDVDSPGGTVQGTAELWQIIMDARGTKPVVAVANSLAASAAYWIASAADEIVVTPTGEVGSIGIIVSHEDQSGAQEQAGVKTTLITAGKRKAMGHPFAELSDEDRASLQGRVDTYYGMMTSQIAKGRGVNAADVRAGFGEGDVVLAQEAVKIGMADRVGTLDSAISRLLGRVGERTGSKAEAPGPSENDRRRVDFL